MLATPTARVVVQYACPCSFRLGNRSRFDNGGGGCFFQNQLISSCVSLGPSKKKKNTERFFLATCEYASMVTVRGATRGRVVTM